MLRKNNQLRQSQEDHWIPLSDLMSGLMMIFLLIAIVFMIQVQREAKKKEAIVTKLETLSTAVSKFEEMLKVKKDETSGGIPKDVPKAKFEKPCPEEEPEEEEKKPPFAKKEMKGAKIESPEETKVEVTADAVPAWYKEIKAYAEKHLMD